MEAKDYIAEIRLHSRITQAEIAEQTGIPQPTISKIIRGEVKDVMSRNYRAIQELHGRIVLKARPANLGEETNHLMTEAAKAGLVERRTTVRRADDRAMRAALTQKGA